MTLMSATEQAQTRTIKALGAQEYWTLYRMGVLPEFQNQGIGRALVAPVFETAAQMDLPVFAIAENRTNLVFLRNVGFSQLEVFDDPIEHFTMWAEPANQLDILEENGQGEGEGEETG